MTGRPEEPTSPTRVDAYRATIRDDLRALFERLKPATVGCFDVAELSVIPLETLIVGGAHTWLVDAEAGRMSKLVAAEISYARDHIACLACDPAIDGRDLCASYQRKPTASGCSCVSRETLPRDPARCTQFRPGRRLRVIHGDARRGRGASFVTRVEAVLASAACPEEAVQEAIEVAKQAIEVDVPLPIEDGAFELVISVLAPALLANMPYAMFDERMTRRFGGWKESTSEEMTRACQKLRKVLFNTQLDAHVRELARLMHPVRGRMYFATLPLEPEQGGTWALDSGMTECVGALSRHFSFDFEAFPAESFLRRSPQDPSVVLQAAVLCPNTARGGGG